MRLTLRTMLAYLDNVLEPADAEVLGKKVNESDFARGLAQRIGVVTKKLRIDAPKLDGKGMGNDPNTVAEYLDSTLPPDRIGDFERICLESDKHLCEVAACHQVLTLVLGKPAQVPMELRERVYALGRPATGTAASPPIPADGAGSDADVAPPPVAGNGRPQEKPAPLLVPDYLRAGRRSVWPLVAAAAVALLLALGVLRLMGPFDSSHPLARLFGGSPTELAQRPDGTDPAELQPPDIGLPGVDRGDAAPATDRRPDVEATRVRQPGVEHGAALPGEPAADDTGDVAPAVDNIEPRPETPEEAPLPVTPPGGPGEDARPDPPAAITDPALVAGAAPEPVPAEPAAEPTEEAPVASAEPRTTPRARRSPTAAAEPAEAPLDVGRYTSDTQLLAAMDEETGLCYAKAPRAVLVAGEQLVALGPYRPQVALPSGVQVTFAGESAMRMGRPAESGASHMAVDWGRFIVVTVGAAGAQIDLNLAGVPGLLTLVDADSSVAVRVGRWLPPGTDPEEVGSYPVVEIFSTHGRVTWHEQGEEKVTIPVNHVYVYIGDEIPETLGPFQPPEWLDSRSVAPIDRQASLVLEAMLPPDKPLNLSLQEAMQDRRVEVRALAARCLAFLGDFEPALRELADSRQYSFWGSAVESLRQAVAAGPPSAAAVRETIDRVRPAVARDLYRMTWGYSDEQLERSAAAQLVKLLESDQMDVRVLAFHNLQTITGAQEFYRAERPPQAQRAALQNWKQRLDRGTIVWKTPPSPLSPYKPLAEPTSLPARPAPPRSPLEMPLGIEL
jgi:hypothetical protein